MQFQIIHKVSPSNSYISRFDNSVPYLCNSCKVKDSTVHMFFECIHARQFWKQFEIHVGSKLEISTNVQNVLLGYIDNVEKKKIVNYCFMYAKYFMLLEKRDITKVKETYRFDYYVRYMKHILLCEKECHLLEDKYEFLHEIFNQM